MANPELGAKQICPNCQAKFYDLTRRPAHCPKCEHDFEPEEALKARKSRGRGGLPDYEDTAEESEDVAKAKKADDDEEEEEEDVKTPEIDEAANEIPPVGDDDDEDADPATDAGLGESDDEVLEDEEDDSVPFIEGDDEDFEDEIEGLGPDEEEQ